ncbi:MAG: pilus assembly protein TadG-related protein [Nevskiaceae bacterium]|nr:pilus assembly protein TadG-related protein [Nevskiaceae bacterium]
MSARHHNGQAMLVVLAFLATLAGGFLVVFSVGQVVNDKVRLVNAADAAAFSAAQWQARSLNYEAYLNRAIVANEVAIAQLVSLRSWSHYMDRTISNAETVSNFYAPARVVMQVLERAWSFVDRAIERVGPMETALSVWNGALVTAQTTAYVQASPVAANLVSEVVAAQEPRAEVYGATHFLRARNDVQWFGFTKRYQRGGGELDRYTQLLMDSRDGFSAQRSGDLLPADSLLQVSKRGGTDLIGEYTWRGLDTLAVHIDLGIAQVEIPVGWGAAERRKQSTVRRGEHDGSYRRNPQTSRLAQRALTPAQGYLGVPEIRDLAHLDNTDDQRIGYSVALRLPQQRIDTADRLVLPQGLYGVAGEPEPLTPLLAESALHALGSAEVYFRRPEQRSDGRQEYPSLFNPYWQARLSTVPNLDRQLSAPFRGLSWDPFGVGP